MQPIRIEAALQKRDAVGTVLCQTLVRSVEPKMACSDDQDRHGRLARKRTAIGRRIIRMEPARKKGKRWVISTREEMRQAAIEVARTAKRKVSIFTHDLEPGIYDDPDFLEVIKRLVLSQTYSRIRVLIADPSRAIKNGNNFVHLGRRLNSYIEFRHVREDLCTHAEAFCIADETGLVYRLQAERWEGIADTYEPSVAKLYGRMFDEIWLASEVHMEFRQIGV